MDHDSAKPRRNNLHAWILGLAAVALLAGLGWWAAESQARVADVEMRDQLLQQAVQIAMSVNRDMTHKLTFTASDKGTPAFECLREQMTTFGNAVPNARWLYCMTKRDDRIIFGIGIGLGDAKTTEPPAKPGDVYEDASTGLRQRFGEKRPFTDGPYTDKRGTFVSAYVPVFDQQTGELLMVIGLDVEAKDWNALVSAARRGPILATLIMMLVLAGGLMAIRWHNRHRTQDSLKLKVWIVVPTALAASAGLAIFGTYQYIGNVEESSRNILRFTEQTRAECDRYVNSEVQLLRAQLDRIADNPTMLKAWQDRDLPALNALVQPEFEKLKHNYGITHFYFIAPDRTCFLRVHQPNQRGDLIERSTMLAAVRTGEDVWGTELGAPHGTCTLRYVRPWKRDGRIIGYLELGVEVGHLVNQLAQDMDADIVAVIRKEYTTRESYETGRPTFGFVGQWDDYRDFVVAHQTEPHLSDAVMQWLTSHDAPASGIEVFDTNEGKKHFACGVVHLSDAVSRNVADLIVIRDVTVQFAAAQSDLLWSLGLAFALIGGVLVLLWSVTGEAERQLSDAFATVRVSRERFAQVAETSREFIWEVDTQGLYTYASHACKTLLGYDENEVVGKLHFYDLHPEKGRDEFRRQALAVFDRKESFGDLPNEIITKDGRVLVVLTNGVPILNADGTLQGYRGSDKDITERKHTEEALRESEEWYKTLFVEATDGICLVDAETGEIIDCNQALTALVGRDKAELIGQHQKLLHPPVDEGEPFSPTFKEHSGDRMGRILDTQVITKTGELKDVSIRARIVNLGGRKVMQGLFRDVTDRKRAEEAMEKRVVALTQPLGDVTDIAFEDLFNLDDIQRLQDDFARATGVASIITRTDGTPITTPSNFCRLCKDIIRKTDKGCENCCMSAAVVGRFHPEGPVVRPCMSGGLWDAGAGITVGGQHIANWLVGQVRDETQTEAKMIEYAREIGADEKAFVGAFQEVRSMSREQFELVAKALFTLANQLSTSAYQNVQQARFITERKQAEDALLRAKAELQQYVTALELSNHALKEVNQLAEAATRAKSEFLANMSHEIRTPMTAILGYADIMLEENIGRNTREHVEVIKRNGKHLLDIINDILDLSKVEAGKMQIEPARFSPVELLAEIVALMRVRADAKHLKLVTERIGPIPETVLTDPLRLRQVLVNLVGNAIKFTDHGEIRITTQLTQDGGRPHLRINVTDTGIGMTKEDVGRLFRAFTQVDSSATRKFGGSGMGLCISRRLAEALGGTIKVHSAPGKGSTFSVTIDPGPLEGVRMLEDGMAAAVRPLPISTPADDDKIELHGQVLLAEDGPDNQRLICMLLRKAGADVVAVENGQLAVNAALAACEAGKPFGVILMDMQMPVMDGYSATRRLREWGYTGSIVALTAHAMDQDCQKCLDAGCDDYATKPIDRQTLLAMVAHWTVRSQTYDDASNPSTPFLATPENP